MPLIHKFGKETKMKMALIICGTVALLLILVTACSKRRPKEVNRNGDQSSAGVGTRIAEAVAAALLMSGLGLLVMFTQWNTDNLGVLFYGPGAFIASCLGVWPLHAGTLSPARVVVFVACSTLFWLPIFVLIIGMIHRVERVLRNEKGNQQTDGQVL